VGNRRFAWNETICICVLLLHNSASRQGHKPPRHTETAQESVCNFSTEPRHLIKRLILHWIINPHEVRERFWLGNLSSSGVERWTWSLLTHRKIAGCKILGRDNTILMSYQKRSAKPNLTQNEMSWTRTGFIRLKYQRLRQSGLGATKRNNETNGEKCVQSRLTNRLDLLSVCAFVLRISGPTSLATRQQQKRALEEQSQFSFTLAVYHSPPLII